MANIEIDRYFKDGNYEENEVVFADKINKNYAKSTKLTTFFVEALSDTYYKGDIDFVIQDTTTESIIKSVMSSTIDNILQRKFNSGERVELCFCGSDESGYGPQIFLKGPASSKSITIKKDIYDIPKVFIEDSNVIFGDSSIDSPGNNGSIKFSPSSGQIKLENFKTIYLGTSNIDTASELNKKIFYKQEIKVYDPDGDQYNHFNSYILNNRINGFDEETSDPIFGGVGELRLENITQYDIYNEDTEEYDLIHKNKNVLSLSNNNTIKYISYIHEANGEEETKVYDLFNELEYMTLDSKIIRNLAYVTNDDLTKDIKYTGVKFSNISDKTSSIIDFDSGNLNIIETLNAVPIDKKFYSKTSKIKHSPREGAVYLTVNDYTSSSNTTTELIIQRSDKTLRRVAEFKTPFYTYSFADQQGGYITKYYTILNKWWLVGIGGSVIPLTPTGSDNLHSQYNEIYFTFAVYCNEDYVYTSSYSVFHSVATLFNQKMFTGVKIKAYGTLERWLYAYDENIQSQRAAYLEYEVLNDLQNQGKFRYNYSQECLNGGYPGKSTIHQIYAVERLDGSTMRIYFKGRMEHRTESMTEGSYFLYNTYVDVRYDKLSITGATKINFNDRY